MFLESYYADLGVFLYLIPIISCLWAAFALLANKNRILPQIYLAIVFLALTIGMSFSFFYDRYIASIDNNILRSLNMVFSVFCVITVWFYFISLMRPDKLTKNFILRYVLIAVVYAVFLSIPEYIQGWSENISGWQKVFENISHPAILFRLLVALTLIGLDVYLIIQVLKIYLRHRRFVKEFYSYEESISLNWIGQSMFLFFILGLFDIAWMLDSSLITKAAFNVISIIVIVRVFWLGYRQEKIPTERKEKDKDILYEDDASDIDRISTTQQNKLEMQLLAYFEEKQPFLNPELSLNDVVKALNTNRTYLSQLFNQQLNTTFYLFVNKYRIEYAIGLIEKNHNISIDTLAEKSGFRSRSVFYKNFKEITGIAPSVYMRKK